MNKEERYKLILSMLNNGETDLLYIGKQVGYSSEKETTIRSSCKRFIKNNLTLKLLYEQNLSNSIELRDSNDIIVTEKNMNYKNNNENEQKLPNLIGLENIKSWDELVETQPNNIFLNLLNEKINSINHEPIEDPGEGYTFILEDKYKELSADDIINVSLRLSSKTKKNLDRFSKKNKHIKKVVLVSQLIDEVIKKYS